MLEKRFNYKEVEEALLQLWATEKTFNFKNEKDKDAFCLMMPPPNVTGSLHIGHALTFTLQDIIVRFQKKKLEKMFFGNQVPIMQELLLR